MKRKYYRSDEKVTPIGKHSSKPTIHFTPDIESDQLKIEHYTTAIAHTSVDHLADNYINNIQMKAIEFEADIGYRLKKILTSESTKNKMVQTMLFEIQLLRDRIDLNANNFARAQRMSLSAANDKNLRLNQKKIKAAYKKHYGPVFDTLFDGLDTVAEDNFGLSYNVTPKRPGKSEAFSYTMFLETKGESGLNWTEFEIYKTWLLEKEKSSAKRLREINPAVNYLDAKELDPYYIHNDLVDIYDVASPSEIRELQKVEEMFLKLAERWELNYVAFAKEQLANKKEPTSLGAQLSIDKLIESALEIELFPTSVDADGTVIFDVDLADPDSPLAMLDEIEKIETVFNDTITTFYDDRPKLLIEKSFYTNSLFVSIDLGQEYDNFLYDVGSAILNKENLLKLDKFNAEIRLRLPEQLNKDIPYTFARDSVNTGDEAYGLINKPLMAMEHDITREIITVDEYREKIFRWFRAQKFSLSFRKEDRFDDDKPSTGLTPQEAKFRADQQVNKVLADQINERFEFHDQQIPISKNLAKNLGLLEEQTENVSLSENLNVMLEGFVIEEEKVIVPEFTTPLQKEVVEELTPKKEETVPSIAFKRPPKLVKPKKIEFDRKTARKESRRKRSTEKIKRRRRV